MPAVVVGKVIKPRRFNDRAFAAKIEAAMHKAADVIEGDFEETTKTWKHKPRFDKTVSLTPPVEVMVGTDDEIYRYVNDGTEAHEIWAGAYTGKSDKKALAFSSQFVPKTKPGIIGSNPGFVGERDTFTPYVQHPGTEARAFDKAIKRKRESWFKRQMEAAMREAARASGHAA